MLVLRTPAYIPEGKCLALGSNTNAPGSGSGALEASQLPEPLTAFPVFVQTFTGPLVKIPGPIHLT